MNLDHTLASEISPCSVRKCGDRRMNNLLLFRGGGIRLNLDHTLASEILPCTVTKCGDRMNNLLLFGGGGAD